MTVIAYKNGILASDSLVTLGTARAGSVRKICRGPNGSLAGLCGNTAYSDMFMSWIKSGEPNSAPDLSSDSSFTAIVIRPNGKVYMACSSTTLFLLKSPFHSIGSGSDFAVGAMEMGATAEEAVRVAIKHCISCGGKVVTEKLT